MEKQHKFAITAARGMMSLLADELKKLGIKNIKQEQSNIRFTGTLEQAYTVCLWSRVALRVLLPIAHIPAETPEELYEGIKAIAWEDHIEAEGTTIAVEFNSFRSKIKHTQYGSQRVKDAIVDRFREDTGVRPSVDLLQPDLRVNVYLKHNQATVSIDLSGESLHKRGYRVSNTSAPLKENLAAAILMQAEWPSLAKQGWGLLDPMCGSGTFLIESTMMAADIAPNIQREYFGFLYWKKHNSEAWKRLKADAERRKQAGLSRIPIIMGGDMDKAAVNAALANVSAAGLSDKIHITQRPLQQWANFADEFSQMGLLVANPPYGERIGDTEQLPHLYDDLGELVTQTLPGWRTAIITNDGQLGKFTGLTLFESLPFDNGPIECEVLYYRAPKPVRSDEIKLASLSDNTAETQPDSAVIEMTEQGEMFANRLNKNMKHLAKWARKNSISCYRLYDADLPDYALAIDLYGSHVHVQEYAPPKQIDPQKAVERLQEAMRIIPDVLDIPANQVVLKVRKKQQGTQQYEANALQNKRFEVEENGLKFWVNLKDYLDTGLFLDHRDIRHHLMKNAQGKNFLNLFCYTSTATVYAAAGGANSTTSVDMSNTYLAWSQDNLKLNGLTDEKHNFVRADCMVWLAEAVKDSLKYDLIFLDPPTFSNSSKMEGVLDIQRDHVDLIQSAMALLTPQGKLIFSTNRRDFKLQKEALADVTITDITSNTMPKDFERNTKIHYCWQISK